MFEYRESRNTPPAAAFFILIGMIGAAVIVGSLIGGLVWLAMTGQSIFNIEADMKNPKFANAARMVQLVSAFFALFVPAVGGAMIMSRRPFKFLGFFKNINIRQVALIVLIMLACMPLVGTLAELTEAIPLPKSTEAAFKKMEDMYTSQVGSLATIRNSGEFIYSLIVLALLPALFEEALFRGGMQQILLRWFKSPAAAIIVTSILFSIIHLSYYGFLARFALGAVLGLLFHYSGSLWPSITAHFLNNAAAVSYMYYQSLHGKPATEDIESGFPIWVAIPAVIVIVLLLKAYKKVSGYTSAAMYFPDLIELSNQTANTTEPWR